MGRHGITYEMVEAAADALQAERPGVTPTLAAVRAHLGTGSPNTIHKYLRMWNENRPKAVAQVLTIPEEISRALSSWVLQQATGSRADAEERSVQAQAAADELAKVGEDLEAERDQLLADIAALTTQRDQHQATASERSTEIDRLLAEIERERSLAGAAQVDAAQARLRAESQVENLTDLKTRVESLSISIEAERAARTAAERDAAVGVAQLASVTAERDAGRAQVLALQQELVAARERADQIQIGIDQLREQHREEMNGMHQAVDQARDQVLAITAEKFKLQGQLQELERERASLAAQLSAVHKHVNE
jgi:colicin import membrane protein